MQKAMAASLDTCSNHAAAAGGGAAAGTGVSSQVIDILSDSDGSTSHQMKQDDDLGSTVGSNWSNDHSNTDTDTACNFNSTGNSAFSDFTTTGKHKGPYDDKSDSNL